jgi:hypothetical protein
MEIINDSQAEPRRLQALIRLIAYLEAPKRQESYDLLQPPALVERFQSKEVQSAAKTTYGIAVERCLVKEDDKKVLRLQVDPKQIDTMSAFQAYMQKSIMGETQENQTNFKFNLFSAWYAVQNERVFYDLAARGYDVAFCAEVFPGVEDRPFNSTKFTAWRKWARFLGLGWPTRIGSRELLVPDATKRIKNVLPALFQEELKLPFGLFMERLAHICPELDGGVLFNKCWQASRGADQPGNNVSLMVSTGLRTLRGMGIIKLIDQVDAIDIWYLYPAEGHQQQVTHIQQVGV